MQSTEGKKVLRKSRSFLRWAGSKKKLLPLLLQQMNFEYNKYIEPFVGSAQLFFASRPESAVLGDSNESLICCFKCVKDNPRKVYHHLKLFPLGKDFYYELRASNDEKWSAEEKAAKFLYLNTFCFNGLYRTNKAGIFNVPYSDSSSKIIDYEELLNVSLALQSCDFVCADFEKVVLEHCEPGDFIYLDPPYAVKNKDIFKQYGPHTFGLSDIERLKGLLNFIDSQGATFLLSYAYCDESIDLATAWNFKIIKTVRNISGFAKHRKQELEILVSNKLINE